MIYDYEQLITELNNGLINSVEFNIIGYEHYNHCCVIYRDFIANRLNNKLPIIRIQLTKDNSEQVSFFNVFDEKYKLFKIKGLGAFSLRDIWHRINITEIRYY